MQNLSETQSRVTVIPSGASVGADIVGVDLSQHLSARDITDIRRASGEHGVIYFRNQRITPEQQIAFCQHFGKIERLKFSQFSLPEHPAILLVSNIEKDGKHIGVHDAGKFWHSDSSYVPLPSPLSFLYAIEVPSQDGHPLGDTQFISSAGLFETLPPKMQQRLEGLKSIHRMSSRLVTDPKKQPDDAIHSVVIRHPVTGRKCIFVNEGLTVGFVGMEEAEGKKLLRELCDLLTAPERIYRHQWRVGDLVVWDNYSTQHHATHNYTWPQHRRLMHRVTIAGEVTI